MLADLFSRLRTRLPPALAWLRLFATPTAYILVIAAGFTVVAKMRAVSALGGSDLGLFAALHASLLDLAVYFGTAALLLTLERGRPSFHALTWPFALLVAALGITSSLLLGASGEQLDLASLEYGVTRWDDLGIIVREMVAGASWQTMLALPLVVIGLPLLVRRLIVIRAGSWRRADHGGDVAQAAFLVAAPAFLVWLILPGSGAPSLRRLGQNAVVRIVADLHKHDAVAAPTWEPAAGFVPAPLIATDVAQALAARTDKPNLLFVVLESTRFDATSLAVSPMGEVATPHLLALAARGTSFDRARTVLPHTTKSLFSIFCARQPAMQPGIYETRPSLRIDCLPGWLSALGWRSAFFQSASGTFEDRPRLAEAMGFKHFAAWDDLRGEPLGYLASDDESLVEPVLAWIDQAKGKPFVAAVLTSATHHPYRMTRKARAEINARRAPADSPEERYLRLVEIGDHMLGRLLAGLAERGVLDNTIVVVMGDHGEGFGRKGVLQHDNNFYEEGLHVPLVIAGPGVPVGRFDANVSLLDVTPTVLGRLGGVALRPAAEGFDAFAADFPRLAPRWFGCLYARRCEGFVLGDKKVIAVPEHGEILVFDLASDPDEGRPGSVDADPSLFPHLEQLIKVMNEHRLVVPPAPPGRELRLGAWVCQPGRTCVHTPSPSP